MSEHTPPSVPPASAEVPMPEGKLWSVLRGAVSDGSWVESHNGTMAHEHVSALLDAKAAVRTEQLLPVVEAYAAAREQAAVERVRGVLRELVEAQNSDFSAAAMDRQMAAWAAARAELGSKHGC